MERYMGVLEGPDPEGRYAFLTGGIRDMADYLESATVSPLIPKEAITDEEVNRLEELGFSYLMCPEKNPLRYYFFVEGGFSEEDEATKLFQEILNRLPPEEYVAIGIEGSCHCTKMRSGDFSGWGCVITRDRIDWMNTSQWVYKKISKERRRLELAQLRKS